MAKLTLKICGRNGAVKGTGCTGENTWLVYPPKYGRGDFIVLESDMENLFCVVRLEDTMPPAMVYLKGRSARFPIPFGERRCAYSPRSFRGKNHVLSARCAREEEIYSYRNLAFNPYDTHENSTLFPHVYANTETRNRSFFAARNVIDGVVCGGKHGPYPYQSWGINKRPDAALTLDFGYPVKVSQVRITLRSDFPHDNYWTKGILRFSDGTEESLSFTKTGDPQVFPILERETSSVMLYGLLASDEPSEFPALKQMEVWGKTGDRL